METATIQVRLSKEGMAAVDQAAERAGVSRSELVRAALCEFGISMPNEYSANSTELRCRIQGIPCQRVRARRRTFRVIQGAGQGDLFRKLERNKVLHSARVEGTCWDDFYGGMIHRRELENAATHSAHSLLLYSGRALDALESGRPPTAYDLSGLHQAVAEAREVFPSVGKIFPDSA